jgi:RHS repeat-associated protein
MRLCTRVGPDTFWLHSDRLGSIQVVTDVTGADVQHRTYRPYGDKLADTSVHVESLGYVGERQDTDTGLTYLHARYYDAAIGTFVSADPASPVSPGVGTNRYAYGLGDPIGTADHSGLGGDRGGRDSEVCERYGWSCGADDADWSRPEGPSWNTAPVEMPPVFAGPGGYIYPSTNPTHSATAAGIGYTFYDVETGVSVTNNGYRTNGIAVASDDPYAALKYLGSIAGKVNNLGNTIPALVLGLAAGCDANIRIGENAIEFYGFEYLPPDAGALTYGNVVFYRDLNPSPYDLKHETNHTYQGELLGPLYGPAHVFLGLYSVARARSPLGWWDSPLEARPPNLPPTLAPWAPKR